MAGVPKTLGPMFMSNVRKYEVQRTNHFELRIDGLSDDITLAVESIGLPEVSNDPIELAFGNSKVKVAGQATYNDVEFTVKDFIEADTEYELWQWRNQVYNPETDAIGWNNTYKRDGTIYQYGPDGTVLRKWKMQGLWPTNLSAGEMNYDGGDKKVISMTLSCDKAYIVR